MQLGLNINFSFKENWWIDFYLSICNLFHWIWNGM